MVLICYSQIVVTVLRILFAARRTKIFICSSLLTVVFTFYGTIIVLYIAPSTVHSQLLLKVIAILFTMVTPILTPGISDLRNLEIQKALKRLLYCKTTEM